MVSPDSIDYKGQWESISNIYITKIVVLVSEPVRGRSRATELPCLICATRSTDNSNEHTAITLEMSAVVRRVVCGMIFPVSPPDV